jgi:hypothetical protein
MSRLEASCLESASFARRIGAERRQQRHFVVNERRSGFERRRRPALSPPAAALDRLLVYLRDSAAALPALLVVVNLLSLFDLAFTLHVLRLGVTEGNPLMKYLFASSPTQAAVMKLVVIAAVSLVIWRLRRYRLALLTALFAVAVYASIVIYECVAFPHLL